MTAPPQVSIVIPAFNAEGTIEDQLRALAGQHDAPSFEVLVCDNGSTDATAAIVRSWSDRLESLRLIDASARRGPSAARNIGAAAAKGSLLLFCDADDVVDSAWVATLARALADADAVAGSGEYAELNTHFADRGGATPPFYALTALPHLPAALAGNCGMRVGVFAEIGGFDEGLRVGEDADLFWRMQLAGRALRPTPDAVVHIRDRTSLRGLWRQEFGWGAADRQLAHRYANVRAAYEAAAQSRESAAHAAALASGELPSPTAALRAVSRIRRPRDLAYAVRRLGRRAGRRWGRVDRAAPQITVPTQLPAAWTGPTD